MAKYRKKPVVIDAVQWNGRNEIDISKFIGGNLEMGDETLFIQTLEGKMEASVGDYIIKGIKGEFYPCKPDVFEKTYEPVDD